MKKILSILLIICLLGSTLLAVGLPAQEESFKHQENIQISLTPTLSAQSVELYCEQATGFTTDTDYSLPFITKTYTFPIGTTIEDIDITFSNPQTQTLSQPLKTAAKTQRDDGVAISSQLQRTLPTQGYSAQLNGIRQADELLTQLTIKLYPASYEEQTQLLTTYQTVDISYSYTPTESTFLNDEYDLVIITPDKYQRAAQPLVDHKNSIGIKTILVTLEEIYDSTYFSSQGRDDAEKVKYFLRHALDNWGIEYVLLIGGRNGGIQTEKWDVPVRYSHLFDLAEYTYACDHYYACIYDEEHIFDDWDPDGDGVFAEWTSTTNKEIIDMYPELAVGRLACRTKTEVRNMVNKIIKYENEAYGSSWFKTFMALAGDTYPDDDDPYYEGELATQQSYNFLNPLGFSDNMMWTSNNNFQTPKDAIQAINLGPGFLHVSGHGNPASWGTHPPQDHETWVDAPKSFEMYKLKNNYENPVIIVGGCHNAQFNVSPVNIIRGILSQGIKGYFMTSPVGDFWHMEWIPYSWAWALVNQKKAGGIAAIANTGYGYGIPGEDWNTGRGRWMEMKFFESYANGNTTLGDTFTTHLTSYLDAFPPFEDRIDTKIVQQWVLLGDPSLQIGGVEN